MTFDIARHAIDDMGQGFAGVGQVGVIVYNGGCINCAVGLQRPQALVPMDMTRNIRKRSTTQEGILTQKDRHRHRTLTEGLGKHFGHISDKMILVNYT